MPKDTFHRTPALHALLAAARVKLVDVGGRGAAMPALACLAGIADYYTCEPDAQEAAHLEQALSAGRAKWRSVTVLREAIASRVGAVCLHVTEQPGMSSLLEPDPRVARRFYLAGKFKVARDVMVPAITLDDAAQRYGFSDAAFLKLDTQGTELDILQSGAALVRDALLGVYVECSFRPFYREQPLFSDVDGHLRAAGFSLFTMMRTGLRRANYHPALYSKRVTTWAHCLYLREPETLGASPLRLQRLLALALAFEHIDLAFEVIEELARVDAIAPEQAAAARLELDEWARASLDEQLRKAEKQTLTASLMAPALNDRKRAE